MRKQRVPGIVTVAILTVITVVFWIILDVYRTLTVKPAPTVSEEILSPIDPDLDQTYLNRLQQRVFLNETEIGTIEIQNPQETPVEPESTPEATSGGAINE